MPKNPGPAAVAETITEPSPVRYGEPSAQVTSLMSRNPSCPNVPAVQPVTAPGSVDDQEAVSPASQAGSRTAGLAVLPGADRSTRARTTQEPSSSVSAETCVPVSASARRPGERRILPWRLLRWTVSAPPERTVIQTRPWSITDESWEPSGPARLAAVPAPREDSDTSTPANGASRGSFPVLDC